MKKITVLLLLILGTSAYGQINYYSFNNSDSIFSEKSIESIFRETLKTLPGNITLIPTIYHKVEKKDSIINYITFSIETCEQCSNKELKFVFKQDPVFLLLNKKLPDFQLPDLDDNILSSNQLKGKPTLLNYWSISCSPCIAEMPELSALKNRYSDKVNFIALTENTCKDDDLKRFLLKHPYNFQILQNALNYKKTLNITAIPRSLFIDRHGYIRYIQGSFPYTKFDPQNGVKEYNDNNYFVKIINELLNEK